MLPLFQLKCSFKNICGNRKTVRGADCFRHSLSVAPECGIPEHPSDRCYKIRWGRVLRGDDNAQLLVLYGASVFTIVSGEKKILVPSLLGRGTVFNREAGPPSAKPASRHLSLLMEPERLKEVV